MRTLPATLTHLTPLLRPIDVAGNPLDLLPPELMALTNRVSFPLGGSYRDNQMTSRLFYYDEVWVDEATFVLWDTEREDTDTIPREGTPAPPFAPD